jgi:hypothetical protein
VVFEAKLLSDSFFLTDCLLCFVPKKTYNGTKRLLELLCGKYIERWLMVEQNLVAIWSRLVAYVLEIQLGVWR